MKAVKRTVVVMLVRAVGVTPFWKDSAALCIVGSLVPTRDDLGVGGGSAAVCMWQYGSFRTGVLIYLVWLVTSRQYFGRR